MSSGVYGQHCDKVCPDNCQESRCDIINGTCLGCTPGWVGAHCYKSNLLFYEKSFSTCEASIILLSVYFYLFNKACPVGYYGLQCESKCFGHCKDSETCNHINGLCDNGCDDGWTESNCNKGCQIFQNKQKFLFLYKLFNIHYSIHFLNEKSQ